LQRSNPDNHELELHELELHMQNEALRELNIEATLHRERYRDLFEHAPVSYVVLDRDTRILDANVAACDLLRTERGALVGRKLSSFVDTPAVERFTRHLRATMASSDIQSTELSLSVADDGHCDVRIESVRNHLDPQQCRSALVDITALRQLQRQLERSQRLEAVGTFASAPTTSRICWRSWPRAPRWRSS
jgi:PAS domain S-box-containing protein